MYNVPNMKFGKLLEKHRKKARIPQKQLGLMLGLDSSYISKIENGKRNPPSRDVVIEIAGAFDLNETETDQFLTSANYQPQTLFDLGFDTNDFSLKKHLGVLKDIKRKAPLGSYIRAKEEIESHLDLMRMKYTSEVDEELSKNTLLADYLYSKVRRGGLKELYRAVNRPLGGAVVVHRGKILLHQIGISPIKGMWHIPIGYVNTKKGDKTAKDIAERLVKRFLPDVEIEVVRELTAEGGNLSDLDTSEYSIKLGLFPAASQIYEIKIKGNKKLTPKKGAKFVKVSDIPKLDGLIHQMLSQIVRLYFKDKKVAKILYERGEESIEKVISKKDYYEKMKKFDEKRRKNPI